MKVKDLVGSEDNVEKYFGNFSNDMPDDLTELRGEELNFVCQDIKGDQVRITPFGFKIGPQGLTHATKSQSPQMLVHRVPEIVVVSAEEARSEELAREVMKHEICVIRDLAKYVDMDLELFSTQSLRRKRPRQIIEVRKQKFQSDAECRDENGNITWVCESVKDSCRLEEYAAYQMKDETRSSPCKKRKLNHEEEDIIWFGTNVDLVDQKSWAVELNELQKLPEWLRPRSSKNMLSNLSFHVQGMNTVQVYMKVPGSRTPAHQENNNFCSVNINAGPGETEWFATPFSTWGFLDDCCRKRRIQFLKDSWWPDMETLQRAGCPVFRFSQGPADVVFVNIGCVHWVQALGTCNNVAWNVGPMVAEQFQAAAERYEWNRLEKFVSVVPIKRLAWSLAAKKNTVHDPKLRRLIRIALTKSFIQYTREINGALEVNKDIPMSYLGKPENEASFLCKPCGEEVFGAAFGKVLPEEDEHPDPVVYCYACAIKESNNLSGFTLYLEHSKEELINIFNAFE